MTALRKLPRHSPSAVQNESHHNATRMLNAASILGE
jgi:hypothetical protein